MGLDILASPLEIEVCQRRIISRASHQHMVNREGQVIEKLVEQLEVGSIEGGGTNCIDLSRSTLERFSISRCENHLGTLSACSSALAANAHGGRAGRHLTRNRFRLVDS